jgi:outer membrane protein assembly factor BamE
MTMRSGPILLATCTLLAGCGLIEVDRLDVNQGNRLEDREIRMLEVGMSRTQVSELLGTPVLKNPFHQDRWDYMYYETEAGTGLRESPRRLTVYFSGNTVTRIEDRFDNTANGG